MQIKWYTLGNYTTKNIILEVKETNFKKIIEASFTNVKNMKQIK